MKLLSVDRGYNNCYNLCQEVFIDTLDILITEKDFFFFFFPQPPIVSQIISLLISNNIMSPESRD